MTLEQDEVQFSSINVVKCFIFKAVADNIPKLVLISCYKPFFFFCRVEIPLYCLAIIAVVNTIGYVIYRGSNSQKSEFRKNPLNPALARK
jgi:hypothetical protein